MEIWKTVSRNNKYEVSNYGRIRNKDSGYILSTNPTKSHRHPQVFLRVHRSMYDKEQYTLSHIVFEEFVGHNTLPYGAKIGHRDGDIMNNKADNLYRIC